MLLGVLSISLFPSFAWPLAALTLLSYMMKQEWVLGELNGEGSGSGAFSALCQACSGLQQQLTVGEYPPPRNQE